MDTIEIHHPEWNRSKRIYPTAASIDRARAAGWTVPDGDDEPEGDEGDKPDDPPAKSSRKSKKSATADNGTNPPPMET